MNIRRIARLIRALLSICVIGIYSAAFASPEPVVLRPAQSDPGGIRSIAFARNGEVMIALENDALRLWDTRRGRDMGALLDPDGEPARTAGELSTSDDGATLLVATPTRILLLDLESLDWSAALDFPDANGAYFDKSEARVYASRTVDGRNEIHAIDVATGASERVARLRGADRENRSPGFRQLRRLASGAIVGLDEREALLLDAASRRMTRSYNFDHYGHRYLLPGDRLLSLSVVGGATAIFATLYDAETLEVAAELTIPMSRTPAFFGIGGPQSYDPARDRALVYTDQGLFWIGLKQLAVEERFAPDASPRLFAWNAWQREYAGVARLGGRDGSDRIAAWSPSSGGIARQYGKEPLVARRIAPAPGAAGFIVEGNASKLVSLADGQARVTALPRDRLPMWSSRDGRFAVANDFARERLFRIEYSDTGEIQAQLLKLPASRARSHDKLHFYPSVFGSEDGSLVGIANNASVAVYGPDGEERFLTRASDVASLHQDRAGVFSVDGAALVAAAHAQGANDQETELKLVSLDASSGAILWEATSTAARVSLLRAFPDGTFLLLDHSAVRLEWRRFADGSVARSVDLAGSDRALAPSEAAQLPVAVSADGERIAVAPDPRGILIANTSDGSIVQPLRPTPGEVGKIAFVDGGRLLVNALGDRYEIWNAESLDEVASLFLFQEDESWVVATDDQRFDATLEAEDYLYFQQGHRVLPLRLFHERARTPNLLARRLAGEVLPAPDLSVLPRPPTARLTVADFAARGLSVEDDDSAIVVESERARLRLEVESADDFIEEIRVYHNGKALPDVGVRGLAVVDDEPDLDHRVAREIEVALLSGENRFELVALNSARIESEPATLELRYRPPSEAPDRPMRLHLLVVGVNEYQNTNYNLNYAVTDAGAFRDAALTASARLYADTSVTLLVDDQVSRESVLAAFERIAEAARPEDALIFFYAGHGVMSQSDKPEFYLVPPDVTQLYGADDQLAERAIAASELRALAQNIRAQKQLFVLDACQSAGAFQGFGARGAAEEKAIAQLARSTGTHWLAASGSTQFAAEFEELGHGAFTYALLEAFEGKAAASGDILTIRDLDAFLQTRVPELTREHRSSPQYPASYGYGQDFPIALIQ